MGRRIREFNWESTVLGPPEAWPDGLKTAISIMLNSGVAMYIAWSDKNIQLYNDAYVPIFGTTKHPAALGRTTQESWAEIWDFVSPLFNEVLETGIPYWVENKHLVMLRNGFPEDCYFTFSYSVVFDETGAPGGVLATVWETTREVRTKAKEQVLHHLGQSLAQVVAYPQVWEAFSRSLAQFYPTIPFAMVWARNPGGDWSCIAATPNCEQLQWLRPEMLCTYEPLATAMEGAQTKILNIDPINRGELTNPEGEPVCEMAVSPISFNNLGKPELVVLLGINPRRPPDEWSFGFYREICRLLRVSITRIEEASTLLRNQEQQFRGMLDKLFTMVWACDPNGQATLFNQSWLEFRGRTHEEEIGSGWLEGLPPEDRIRWQEAWSEANRHRQPFQLEYRLQNSEGVYRWVLEQAAPRYDSLGEFVGYIGTCLDVNERVQSERQIHQLAFFDSLTGLPNRQYVVERLDESVSNGRTVDCVMIVDLDNFRTINDSLGYGTGDELLKQVGDRLSRHIGATGLVSRLAADEFLIMQNQDPAAPGPRDVATCTEAVMQLFEEPFPLGERLQYCTASLGVVVPDGRPVSAPDILRRAELAMHQAKMAGRDCWRLFNEEMLVAIIKRQDMEYDLRLAIQRQEFTLLYQPQVSMNNEMLGLEALVRWIRPDKEAISPPAFIELAEKTGLIIPLGNAILRMACEQIVNWSNHPHLSRCHVAVNVSARQFHRADFVKQVLDIVNETGANPRRLKLELTEGTLIENVEDTRSKMEALRRRGIGFSLDDFGTGYSSLSYLHTLPFEQLKIDRSFTEKLGEDPKAMELVKVIINLARTMGLLVIAEGVETREQKAVLQKLNCSAYQGYLLARPLDVDSVEAFTRRAR